MYEHQPNPSRPTVRLPDFDELLYLARHQPDELERLRQHLCHQIIASAPAPARKKLEGLQFKIDAQRRISSTPIGACIRISRMMNTALLELCDAFNDPQSCFDKHERTDNNVIPLFKPH